MFFLARYVTGERVSSGGAVESVRRSSDPKFACFELLFLGSECSLLGQNDSTCRVSTSLRSSRFLSESVGGARKHKGEKSGEKSGRGEARKECLTPPPPTFSRETQ